MTKSRIFAGLLFSCALSALAASPLPPCAPGWKVEVVVQAPDLVFPSVVCCAPDGRIFVGEDPVDMTSPAASAADKVLCIFPNGKITTFATNLHAVFGLQYIDGKLFVHNSPQFSVFDDCNGFGSNRVDLIKSDNPHPWLPSFNDHIPSNCRLAMDGYLYVSTGDKGVFGAVGTDGRKLEMHGGGVYRMRPNGAELEVYSTGTRNHLDVAINSEDEMFTYDNTDDGCGWWSRMTHMVDGGYYGYPYDYKPQRPYTLWMMVDYGAGAATGACAYDEDALPAEFHGNLFVCDWSRAQVMRLIVERSGASYKVVRRVQTGKLDIMNRSAADDFHPVGICVTPDGKGFYVTDWGNGMWRASRVQGRLFKLTYTGDTTHAIPKPDWFVPAGTAQPFKASTRKLIAGLSHPAESVRLVAQRRLAERKDAPRKLVALLKDTKAPAWARWSAIWTLDAIDGGTKARKNIIAALNDKDPTVQMQAERELGTRRVDGALKPLAALLNSTNAAVRFRAATALGRIGDAAAVPALLNALDEKDLFARYADFFALRRIGIADPKGWPQIVEGCASDNSSVREGVYFAARETYDLRLVTALAAESGRQNLPMDARTNIFALLSSLSLQRPPWNGDWWNTTPAYGKPAAKTADWAGSPVVSSALRAAIRDPDLPIRQIGLEWLHNSHDTNAAAELAYLYNHETNVAIRVSLVRELSASATPASHDIISSILKDPHPTAELLQAALDSAGKSHGNEWNRDFIRLAQTTQNDRVLVELFGLFGDKIMTETVPIIGSNLFNSNPPVCQAAVEALTKIGGPEAIAQLDSILKTQGSTLRVQAISALGNIKARSAIPDLISASAQADIHDVCVTALAQMPDIAALDIYLEGLGTKNASLRAQCESALRKVHQAALPLIEAKLGTNEWPASTIASLRQVYKADAEAKKNAEFRHKVLEVPPGQYQEFALTHPGDARRGRNLFRDLQGVACIRCHRINGTGGEIGPDLTDILAKHSHADVIESVLYPSKQILDGYQQVFFLTRDQDELSGIVRAETAEEVTIIDSAGVKHTLRKSQITSRKTSQISLMPEGLQTGLTLTEFSDLIAFVENPNVPSSHPAVRGPGVFSGKTLKLKPMLTASQMAPPPVEIPGENLFSSSLAVPPPPMVPPVLMPHRHVESQPTPDDPAPDDPMPPVPASLSPARHVMPPPSGPELPPAPPVSAQ